MESLKSIITSSQFESVTIITNLHPEDFGEREEYYEQVKQECLSWMVNDVNRVPFPSISLLSAEANLFYHSLLRILPVRS